MSEQDKKKKKDDENEENEDEKEESELNEDEELEEKTVSKKRVIYSEIDDEVTAVYDKIRPLKAKYIYIVVPKRAVLFQSIVNLKILKKKTETDGKVVHFITNDKNGIYLAQQLGITVYDRPNNEGKPSLFSAEQEDDKLRITPLRATINAVDETAPTRLTEKKISISELLKNRRGKKRVTISSISKPKEPGSDKNEKSKFVLVAPNRHALISLIAVSVIILLVVVYVALPGVTIHLTPTASVLEQSVNITLADYQKNRSELDIRPTHMIASYPIETTVVRSITHTSTGKQFSERGSNASGKITIINSSNAAWPLIPQTRFQTDEGIVFRITDTVNVPAASSTELGKVEALVVADQVDAYGAIVGERGNIGPGRFFLPGLSESSQTKLYAESYEDMTGGVTDYVSFVSEEDVEAAKSRLNDELVKGAIEELKEAVRREVELAGGEISYTLLEGEGAIKVGEVFIEVEEGLSGREVSEFTVSGQVSVSGVYYQHDAMLEILKNELLLKKSPQKELLRINEESTSYRIFEWDEAGGKIKLTVNIKGIEQYEIDPEKENGARLLQKIKDHIKGKDIEEAKQYIQNLPEINKVEIDSWPIWSPTVPSLADNIDFEIKQAMMVE